MSACTYTPLLAFAVPQIIVYPDRVTATVHSTDSSTIKQLTRLLATSDTPLSSSDSPLSAAVAQLHPLAGHDVFCCTHGSRDARCGAAGPRAVQHMQLAAQEGLSGWRKVCGEKQRVIDNAAVKLYSLP